MAQRAFPRFPRGSLSPRLLDCLQQNSVFLEENVDAPHVVRELFSRMIFDNVDRDDILGLEGSRNTRKEQSRRLVDKLTMRTDDGFHAFVQALKDTGHESSFEKITEWLCLNKSDSFDCRPQAQENTSGESNLHQRHETDSVSSPEVLSQLRGRVGHVENRLDMLTSRVTKIAAESLLQQEAEAEELWKRLEDARMEIDNLKKQLENKSQDLEKAEAEVIQLEQLISKLNKEQKVLEDKLKLQERKLKDQNNQIKRQEKKLTDQDNKIKTQENKIKDQAQQILNAESKICFLTDELASEKQQRKKDIGVCFTFIKEMNCRLRENENAVRKHLLDQQAVQSQAGANTVFPNIQTKNSSKAQQHNEPVPAKRDGLSTHRQNRPAPDMIKSVKKTVSRNK